jgi:ArpU family phage transcriptional regulator
MVKKRRELIMVNQLSFVLPEIDREATREAVERALEKYRIYLLTVPEDRLPKITQTFSIVPPSHSNESHSSTEDAAVSNVDHEKERTEHIEKVQRAVNRLGHMERGIVIHRYMKEDDVFDYEVYGDFNISERKYYRLKSRAFYKLAFILKMEVYHEKEVVSQT